MTTDIVMITNKPPRISSSRSVRVTMAKPASVPPRASAPVSPMKILAGGAFHHRKPKQAPMEKQQQVSAGDDAQARQRPAEGERTGVAHEDLGRRGVPPQEAEAGTH